MYQLFYELHTCLHLFLNYRFGIEKTSILDALVRTRWNCGFSVPECSQSCGTD